MNKDIVKQLEIILSNVPSEPNREEMNEIKHKFSWDQIVPKIFAELK